MVLEKELLGFQNLESFTTHTRVCTHTVFELGIFI